MVKYLKDNVFREYDIRGIVKDDFSKEFVISLGRAFASFLYSKNQEYLSISGDVRESTIKLKQYFIEGVRSSGVNVVDLGILP